MGLITGGCLEEIDPISNIDAFLTAGTGSKTLTLAWHPPTENADGSPLVGLPGYDIYIGTDSNYCDFGKIRLDNPGLTTYTIQNPTPGTYYFAATVFNSAGIESSYSSEVVRITE